MKIINRLVTFVREHKVDCLILLGLLLIAGIAHGWNMFHYPYFENDEATYASQAWSFITQGKLAPYTYWYDHAPVGWMFLGLWYVLTGGTHLFGSLLNSGRVLMLILHLVSCVFVYLISLKLTKKRLAGVIAVLLFSLSPLGIYFQRRVLLDNIMIFWTLISWYLLLNYKNKLRYIVLSALTFGVACLSKESAVVFAPAFLYLVYAETHKRHRHIAFIYWIGTALAVVSLYFLYALFKGELFPTGTLLGGTKPHVSLLGSLASQSGRGAFAWPWQQNSQFYPNAVEWLTRDPILMITGAIATLLGIALSVKHKAFRTITLLVVFYWIFLARGKLVIDYYIIPILPLLSILVGAVVTWPSKVLKPRILYAVAAVCILGMIGYGYSQLSLKQYSSNETKNQLLAIQWIEQNLPHNTPIAIDDYAYPALHDQGVDYPNADWFFKIELDPQINKKYDDNWENIHYILLSNQVLLAIRSGEAPLMKQALAHSKLVASFTKGSTSYINIPQYISTNGDWAMIYKVESPKDVVLQDSWTSYKANFIQSYGQIVDKQNKVTTSEGQAYALLRAVQQNDKSTFDGVLAWTKDHMQHRQTDKLFSWKWQQVNGVWKQTDSNTATDADEDIAYALIQAYDTWHDPSYLTQAKSITSDIWNHEVVELNGKYYLASSAAGAQADGSVLINPSYIDPSYYKAFAKIDPSHNWNQLVNDSYSYLEQVQNNQTGMVPDWSMVNAQGQPIPVSAPGLDVDYGYDAFRAGVRVSQDENDDRAKQFLAPLAKFYANQWEANRSIRAVYTTSGAPVSSYGDIAQYAGAVIVLQESGDTKVAQQIYQNELIDSYKKGAWGNPTNYYNQNWAWFGTELYDNNTPSFWASSR